MGVKLRIIKLVGLGLDQVGFDGFSKRLDSFIEVLDGRDDFCVLALHFVQNVLEPADLFFDSANLSSEISTESSDVFSQVPPKFSDFPSQVSAKPLNVSPQVSAKLPNVPPDLVS